jgi:Domain of unknown function (DUF1707)
VPLGYGAMRASSADRERAVDVLKAAFAEGRLDQDEFADRVGMAYSSRTYADLANLTVDLPVGPLGAIPSAPVPFVPGTAFVPLAPAAPPAPAPRRLHASDLALAAFLFALGAVVTHGLTAPVAAVLAVMASFRAWRTGDRGASVAMAAVLLALLSVFLFV